MPLGRSDILGPEVLKMSRTTQMALLVPPPECRAKNFADYDAGIVPTAVLELTAFELTDSDAVQFLDASRSDTFFFILLLVVTSTWGKDPNDDTKEKESIRSPLLSRTVRSVCVQSDKGRGLAATPKEFWDRVSSLSETDAAVDRCMLLMRRTDEFYTKYSNHNLENYVKRTMQVAWQKAIPITDRIEAVEQPMDYVFGIAGELRLFYLAVFDKGALKKSVLRHIVDVFLVAYIKTRCAGSTPDDIRVVMATCETELEVMAEVYRDLFVAKSGAVLSMAYCRANRTQWNDDDGTRWVIVELARMILSGWVQKQTKI